MDTLYKKNFIFLGSTVFLKNAMITCKIQSCTIVLINSCEILQVSIAFFSDTVRPRNLKFILYIDPYGYWSVYIPANKNPILKLDGNLNFLKTYPKKDRNTLLHWF